MSNDPASSGTYRSTVTRWAAPVLAAAAAALVAAPLLSADDAPDPKIELGRMLFNERNFTNPATDYGGSCAECHASGDDVQNRSPRAFADYTAKSLTAAKQTTLRNTPTLLGAAEAPHLGWDGAYDTLESMILDKITGVPMGWKPEDRQRALAAAQFTLLNEGHGGGPGEGYLERFQRAYAVDLGTLSTDDAVHWGARAIGDYVRSLKSNDTAPWDAFVEMNRIHGGPNPNETPKNYSFGVFSRIGNQEGRASIKRPKGFSRAAYEGFKIFFRTFDDGEGDSIGNCVTCHVPPTFTDHRFHDTGIAQVEYDGVHGAGAAAAYELPAQPSEKTRSVPTKGDGQAIDLGRFNAAPKEAGAAFAFKTPTLRDIGGTDPYMHNGAYATLEDAVRSKLVLSEAARAGKYPGIDPEILEIHLKEADIAPLVAFLRQLDDVGKEHFREYLITLADDP